MFICFTEPNFKHFEKRLSYYGWCSHVVLNEDGQVEKIWDADDVERFLEEEDPKVYVCNDDFLEGEVRSIIVRATIRDNKKPPLDPEEYE